MCEVEKRRLQSAIVNRRPTRLEPQTNNMLVASHAGPVITRLSEEAFVCGVVKHRRDGVVEVQGGGPITAPSSRPTSSAVTAPGPTQSGIVPSCNKYALPANLQGLL
jgi:hypothetical protein